MKLKDIMKPWTGETVFCEGLGQDRDAYSLTVPEVAEGLARIAIVDGEGKKTGEIKREILLAVLQSADIYAVSSLMDTFAEGIVALDEKGTIFYANEMYSKILGVPVGKILGRSMYKIEPCAAVLSVLQTKAPVTLQHQFIQTLGRYISCRITPIFRQGVFRGALSVFSDATELVKLSAEIERVSQVAIDLQHQVQAIDIARGMELIGDSPAFKAVVSQASVVASTDAPVLIRGENGTGKEVLAKFIHESSLRADKPLITVNCASIPENLVESELFGYEEGAFTGAARGGRMGKFEMASGGTLFLDEIGDMPLTMQTKLLRAIQEKEIEKIGGRKNVVVDVRIITATNQPLERMIEEKTFRRDLYYRINTVTLTIPSLKERRDDILLFANHFLKKFNEKYGKKVAFSEDVLRWFLEHSWPGNVRELKNCVENGVILCVNGRFDLGWLKQYRAAREQGEEEAGTVAREDAKEGARSQYAFGQGDLRQMLARVERDIMRDVLRACGGNRSEAMSRLGLSRRTFYRKLSEHGLTGKEPGQGEETERGNPGENQKYPIYIKE